MVVRRKACRLGCSSGACQAWWGHVDAGGGPVTNQEGVTSGGVGGGRRWQLLLECVCTVGGRIMWSCVWWCARACAGERW